MSEWASGMRDPVRSFRGQLHSNGRRRWSEEDKGRIVAESFEKRVMIFPDCGDTV
jgi:transposase-like protein